MPAAVVQTGQYDNMTATKLVYKFPCTLLGFFVASYTSTATVQVYDSDTAATSNPVIGAYTLSATGFIMLPAQLDNGLYIVITGTANITPIFAP